MNTYFVTNKPQVAILEDLGEKKETQNEPLLTIIFSKASL